MDPQDELEREADTRNEYVLDRRSPPFPTPPFPTRPRSQLEMPDGGTLPESIKARGPSPRRSL